MSANPPTKSHDASPVIGASDRIQLSGSHERDLLRQFVQSTEVAAENTVSGVQSLTENAVSGAPSASTCVSDMQHVIYDLISAVPDVSTSGALTAAKIALKAMPAGNPGEDQPNAAWRQHSASKADRAEWVTANEGRHVAGIADSFGPCGAHTRAAVPNTESRYHTDASKIASDHAWTKHRDEFPGWSQSDFQNAVECTMTNPDDVKQLSRGRTAYWNDNEKMVVIHTPSATDGGTAFRPDKGKAYFDGQLR